MSQDRYLKWITLDYRHASAPDFIVQFENACGISLGARTVRRWLVECGLLAYQLKKNPLFSKK